MMDLVNLDLVNLLPVAGERFFIMLLKSLITLIELDDLKGLILLCCTEGRMCIGKVPFNDEREFARVKEWLYTQIHNVACNYTAERLIVKIEILSKND